MILRTLLALTLAATTYAADLAPGTVLVSKNKNPALNTSPGEWNHLALVVGTDVIESQAEPVEGGKVGVIRTPLTVYMAREYTPILALAPLDAEAGKRAAAAAEKLVGLPNRTISSVFRHHGERRRKLGLNCVSVVEVAWEGENPQVRRLRIPDDVFKIETTFKAPETIRP